MGSLTITRKSGGGGGKVGSAAGAGEGLYAGRGCVSRGQESEASAPGAALSREGGGQRDQDHYGDVTDRGVKEIHTETIN